MGNDLNDVSMFVEGIKNNDFIVIVGSENKKTVDMINEYLKIECDERGKEWENLRLLQLDEKDANKFLLKFYRILRNMERKNNQEQQQTTNYATMKQNTNRENMQKIKNARKASDERTK